MVLLLSFTAFGQQWEFGANFGGTGYMGDINPNNPFYYNNLGGGLNVKYNFDPTWGVRVQGNYLRIHGSDGDSNNAFQQNRNLLFSNDIWEMSAVGEFHFFRFVPNYDTYSFTPYLFLGVAAIRHNPYILHQDEKLHLMELMIDQDSYEAYDSPRNWAVSIPYGFGLKYNLRGPWTIGVEVGYRTALTNRLDNVSGRYAYHNTERALTYQDVQTHNPGINRHPGMNQDLWEYLADPSGQLSNNYDKLRGSGGKYDGYMTAGLTITYSIVSSRCYWW